MANDEDGFEVDWDEFHNFYEESILSFAGFCLMISSEAQTKRSYFYSKAKSQKQTCDEHKKNHLVLARFLVSLSLCNRSTVLKCLNSSGT